MEQLHCAHLKCQRGCHDCCTNLSVFPVEFYAILEELRAAGVTQISFDESAACGFLKDGLCTIYAARPMICRTHGLPIAFVNMDAEEPEMSVSFCPKNFSEAEDVEFGEESTLNIDELNLRLCEANLQFVEEHAEYGLQPDTRIALAELKTRLAAG